MRRATASMLPRPSTARSRQTTRNRPNQKSNPSKTERARRGSTARPSDKARTARPRVVKPVGRRSSLFVGLFALIVTLNLIGLLMVLSASAAG